MVAPLLTTKLYIPRPRSDLVHRPRLIEQLNAVSNCKLSLISAPAGFGKSTLLSSWVSQLEHGSQVAWLSLDHSDNDLTRFLIYFIGALQTIDTDFGKGVLDTIKSPGPVNIEVVLTSLLNEINEFPDEIVFILDDYHVIESQKIDQALTFLLDHLASNMRLVIASRIDPSMPLSRLRASGQLCELRANVLRFTPDEVASFLNEIMGFDLSAQDVVALETRTEGWIAGLQMAALNMQGLKEDRELLEFINSFTGSNRYIQDYLTDEVLQRQTSEVKDFLLQTSILNRLSGPLCDAVTGQKGGQAILEALEIANMFIVPLDNERQWYRYHHLFADLLAHHLKQTFPDLVPDFHRRASEWYEGKDLPSDAIRHAFAINDIERAADLAELSWPGWSGGFQSITWLGWVKDLPDELVHSRPVLCLAFAWAYLNAGNLEDAEVRLSDVERWLEPSVSQPDQSQGPLTEMVVVDQEKFQSLPESLATARAYHAQAIGDIPGTVKYAQKVLELLPEGNDQWRAAASSLLGLAQYANGELEAAYQAFSDGLVGIPPLDRITGTFVLADIKMALGQLNVALTTYKQSLKLAKDHGKPMPLGAEDIYIGLSKLYRERGNLDDAAQDLLTGKKLGEQIDLPDWQHRWCIAQAQLKETLGDLDSALDLLDKAEKCYVRTPVPNVRPIAAMKARVWVRQGKLAEAQDWMHEHGLAVDDNLSYLREFEHITLAKVLIAQYLTEPADDSICAVIELLNRLLKAAEEGGRKGSVIEILIHKALAYEAQGNSFSALASLERALILAEPEGYLRIFVDQGPPMAKILNEAARRGYQEDYSRKLLAAFESKIAVDYIQQAQQFIEPLSARELDVLKLVAQGLSNREIGERLFLALDTVKGYNRKIYAKLGVKNRTQAVNKANSLKILPPQ
jgi:LuxR family maltose regulon positive regulatory protein